MGRGEPFLDAIFIECQSVKGDDSRLPRLCAPHICEVRIKKIGTRRRYVQKGALGRTWKIDEGYVDTVAREPSLL